MPAVADRPWKRRSWLVGMTAALALALLDSCRRPQDQVSAAAYIAAVRVYQAVGRPVVRPVCVCRYYPSCSEYSVEAVRTHGLRYGLYLTLKRLASCNGTAPLGTWDPVPPPDEWK